jgi:anaerobic dimethyl sulfoxide reductase subunit A
MPSVPVFCGKDCGGNACPLLAEVEDGVVIRVVNNPDAGPYLKGCPRGFHLPDETYAPDRILTPLIRVGPRGSGSFREASWEEALTLTTRLLSELRDRFGPQSVLRFGSAGSTGALHSTGALLSRFLNLFGGCTQLTGNYSNAAASFILPYLLGKDWTRSGFDPSTMQDAQMIILWGANVLETRQGTEVPQRLLEASRRGIPVVVIDPRRSATARHTATWWIPCKPGTDAALMLAVLHVLCSEDLVDRAFCDTHSIGFVELENQVLGRSGSTPTTPQWAESICGVPASEIIRFARAYAAAKPAMLFPGFSIQRVFAGEEPYRLAIALQIATGNFGQRGGSTGSMNQLLPAPRAGHLPVPQLSDLPKVPISSWADAVLGGRAAGYPTDIHTIYSLGGNYLNQGNDIRKNIAAFNQLDFAVTHEFFMTPTARYCDVIFPAATALEKSDIGYPWLGNYLLFKPQVVAPQGQARNDYDILFDLADRLGFGAEFSEGRQAEDWIEFFISTSEITDIAAFKQKGIYLAPDQDRVGLSDFSSDPLAHPLSTPSGKVEITSPRFHKDTDGPSIPTWLTPPTNSRYPLRLITPKSPHRTHSQGSNLSYSNEKARHALEMHPSDAQARGCQEGDTIRLLNDLGECQLPLRLTEDIMPGVVCLPEGMWVRLGSDGIDHAGAANMLTSTQGTEASSAVIMHAIGVEVCPLPPRE